MAAGIFTSRDTYAGRIQDILSQNRYTYAENNPVTYADPSGHISIKSAWNAVKTGAKAVASAVTAAVKSGAAAVSNAVKSVISKPAVTLGNTSRSSGGTVSAYAKVSGAVRNQAAQKKAAKSAAWADFVGQPLTVCEAAAAWADWGAEKAAGYMDQSLWGPGLMVGAYEVEAVKCFAYSQLENSIHLIIPEADVERMLKGAGLMIGGCFKSFGGAMLAAGSSTLSWTGLGVLGMAAGGFVVGAGASDINQGGEEFFLGMSGDSATQTRNGMSDLFYDGNDGIYHLSTGFAAFMGSLLTPYVACAAKTTTVGSTAGNPAPTVTEAAGGTVDDALEQFYDDIFESSYGKQFDPVKEQAIAGAGDIAETMESAASGSNIFKPPSITTNSRGELTNGLYTLNQNDMLIHVNGKNLNKSQFLYNVDANKAVLDAAAYADEFNLWEASSGNMADFANKAKIPVTNGYVGITGNGELTTYINVYRTKTGYVHGCPGNP